jgi:Ca2+-binding RTX toxin-like protein
MVKFVAKNLPVDNSDLYELDGYKPFSPTALSVGIASSYKNGVLSVKVTQDGALKYKIAKIEVAKGDVNKLFKGDSWEPKLFKGADEIKGSTQGDILYGYNGNDQISGNAGVDTIYGGKGNDKLYGGADGDLMYGGAGKDFLDGDTGVNTLTGGSEKDKFAFSAALAGGNYSEITDFEAGTDKIQLDKDAFAGIGGSGTLAAGKFFLASDYAGKAKSVVYDDLTGNLYYAINLRTRGQCPAPPPEPALAAKRSPAGAKQDRRGRKGWAFARHGIHRYRAKHIVANDNYAEARLAA